MRGPLVLRLTLWFSLIALAPKGFNFLKSEWDKLPSFEITIKDNNDDSVTKADLSNIFGGKSQEGDAEPPEPEVEVVEPARDPLEGVTIGNEVTYESEDAESGYINDAWADWKDEYSSVEKYIMSTFVSRDVSEYNKRRADPYLKNLVKQLALSFASDDGAHAYPKEFYTNDDDGRPHFIFAYQTKEEGKLKTTYICRPGTVFHKGKEIEAICLTGDLDNFHIGEAANNPFNKELKRDADFVPGSRGAIGVDLPKGRFAIFPNSEEVIWLLVEALYSPAYRNKTIDEMVEQFAELKQGTKDHLAYADALCSKELKVYPDTKVNKLNPEQLIGVIAGIAEREGWKSHDGDMEVTYIKAPEERFILEPLFLPHTLPGIKRYGHNTERTKRKHHGVDLYYDWDNRAIAERGSHFELKAPYDLFILRKSFQGKPGYGHFFDALIFHNGKPTKIAFKAAHLSSVNVKEGDFVEKGAVLGYTGSSGTNMPEHLHLELEALGSDGKWHRIDPMFAYGVDLSYEPYVDELIRFSLFLQNSSNNTKIGKFPLGIEDPVLGRQYKRHDRNIKEMSFTR